MPAKVTRTIDIRSRKAWRTWLERNHSSAAEIWLVFHKQHTGTLAVEYEAAVEEALCFGWVDSLVRRLDENRFARKFTPRRTDSVWSESNRRRYAEVAARGLLAPSGRARPPTGRVPDPPARRMFATVPTYIARAFKSEPRAWATFERLTQEQRHKYLGWIDAAKRDDTKTRRLAESVRLLARGEKLGLK